jgi:hypothetical protein
VLGRFLSADPVPANPNTGASFCRYCYANDNPYRFTDPDGRETGPAYKALYDAGNPGAPPAGPYEPPPTEGVEAVAPELYFIGGGGLRAAAGFATERMAIRAAANEARAVASVTSASGKSIRAAIANINKAGLAQKQGIAVVQNVVKAAGKQMGMVAGPNGTKYAIGAVQANLAPAVQFGKDGVAALGTVTVKLTESGTDILSFAPAAK